MDKLIWVDWQITSKCNRACNFCFGPSLDYNELSTEKALKIIEVLDNLGVNVIGITGGEPLLRDDINTIIKNIYDRGMSIYLSTNCDYYTRYRKYLLNYIDIFGIPFESFRRTTHDSIRGDKNFDNVEFALKDIFDNCSADFRIGTVITNRNYGDLSGIENYLFPFKERILCWKLYGMIQYKEIRKKSNELYIEPAEIRDHLTGLGNLLGRDKIIYYTPFMRNRSYFLIRPDGNVFIPILDRIESKEMNLGNILKVNSQQIFESWSNEVLNSNYMSSYRMINKRHKSCPTRNKGYDG